MKIGHDDRHILSFQIDIEGTTATASATTPATTALPEVTSEVLEQEYMRYLQWAYVDIHSDLASAAQLKEMQVCECDYSML